MHIAGLIDAAQWSLWIAVALTLGSALVAWRGGRGTALALLAAASAFLWFAVIALGRALVRSDFSLVYVVDHSRQASRAPYRLAGMWGGMAGSLLLWSAILSLVVGLALARHAMGRVAHLAGAGLMLATTLIVVLAADPFERLAIPAISGRGLTPILDHPAMLIHPPILYTGLLLTATPFLLAVDAAVRRDQQFDRERTARAVRASALLTGVGLVLGASWAYVELGWGGYWAWDPVENAALMPWLGLIAWLHSARSAWATPRLLVALAAMPLVLVFFGAWMTRAGLSVSVHAFAETPGVGRGFAVLFVATTLVTVWVGFRGRGPVVGTGHDSTAVPVALAALLLTAVVLGTAYPLVRDALTDDTVTVEGGYFSRAAWPLGVVAGVALAVLLLRARRRIAVAVGLGATAAGLALDLPWFGVVLITAAGAAAAIAALGFITDARRRVIHLAHLGFAVVLVGMAGTTGTTSESVLLGIGEAGIVRDERVVLDDITVDELGSGRTAVTARLTVDGTALAPARVAHSATDTVLAETDTDNRWDGDLQVVLRDVTDDLAVVEFRYRPLAGFIWWGAAVMLLGLALGRHASSGATGRRSTEAASEPRAAVVSASWSAPADREVSGTDP